MKKKSSKKAAKLKKPIIMAVEYISRRRLGLIDLNSLLRDRKILNNKIKLKKDELKSLDNWLENGDNV